MLLTLFVVALPSLDLLTDGWPDFRGPTSDGHAASSSAPPLAWSEKKNVTWKTAIHGKAWSTPVVRDDRVWLTTATEDGTELSVLALDLESGKVLVDRVLFEVEEPGKWRNKMNSYASPSPAIEAGRVFVHFGTYGTACLDTENGETLWERRDVNCDHMEGPGSSLVLFEDLLIFHMDGGDVQYIIALNKLNGETVWRTDRTVPLEHLMADQRKAYSTPIVVETGGRLELISSGAEATNAYDPRTGRELWRVEHPGFSMSSRPVAGDGLTFVNTGFMKAQLWALRTGPLEEGEERIAWKGTKGIPTVPSPILVDEYLYFVDDAGSVTCVDAATGDQVWRERLDGEYAASPIYAGGRLYFFNREGRTTVLKPGAKFKVLAENRLDEAFMASPAVIGDALILRTRTHVYRVE